MNWKRAFIPALVVLPFLILLGSRFGTDPSGLDPNILKGQAAPKFALKTLDGADISLEALKGKPVVLNFWATWCIPCKTEHDILQQGAARFGEQVQFLGVVYQDGTDAAREYLKRRIDRYPNLIDDNASVAIDYGVSGVPETYFVDGNGVIRHKQVGPVTPSILTQKISEMLTGG